MANRHDKNNYAFVIKKAENVIGYPTSFLNLRWIVNDEIANIATHFKKLLATKHPILRVARRLLLPSGVPSWGLIVLLLSKMIENKSKAIDNDLQDSKSGILYSQRTVAECVEMLRTSNVLHKAIVGNHMAKTINDELLGNKMSLLGGDFLLAKSLNEIALLRNDYVQELMSSSLRDMTESQFLGLRDNDNNPLPSKPNDVQNDIDVPECFTTIPIDSSIFLGNMKSEWILRKVLDSGHLLARACQSALLFSVEDDSITNLGYRIGRNYALFEHAHNDLKLFNEGEFSLLSAPVMLHLEGDPKFYVNIEKGLKNVNDIDYNYIRDVVMTNGYGIRRTKELKNIFHRNVLNSIDEFPNSDAKNSLIDIMVAINNVNL